MQFAGWAVSARVANPDGRRLSASEAGDRSPTEPNWILTNSAKKQGDQNGSLIESYIYTRLKFSIAHINTNIAYRRRIVSPSDLRAVAIICSYGGLVVLSQKIIRRRRPSW